MTSALAHADLEDITKGSVYRSLLVPRWTYRVDRITDTGSGKFVEYVVIGGDMDGTQGKILLREFARRVKA